MVDLDRADARLYKAKLLENSLAPTTVKKLLTGASTLCRFAVVEGWLNQNPFSDGLTRVARKGAQTAGRLPYSPAQIVTLLTAAAKLEGASKWMPWLGAFTGGRREELGGCRVQDVKQEAGIWFLDIVATPERRLKNLGSARRVVLHPRLIHEGLLEYVQTLPKEGRLFPELRPDRHGTLTAYWGKEYAAFSDECGITDPRTSYHSYRHSFKTACREAGISEEIHDRLTGHQGAGVGRSYGTGPSLKVLAEAVEKIRFEGLD
jgi:integrase